MAWISSALPWPGIEQATPGEPPAPWSLPLPSLLLAVGSTPAGLTSAEAAARGLRYRSRRLAPRPRTSALRLFVAQFDSPIMLLLLFAASLSLVTRSFTDGVIILLILFVSGALGFWQEHGASRAVDALLARVRVKADVLRDGRASSVPADQVVPGDVVLLRAGDQVPGDGVLLEARGLFLVEAPITGESFPVEKVPGPCPADAPLIDRRCAVHQGTHVMSGSGTAVVTAVGRDTELGRVSSRLRAPPPLTDFDRGIHAFGALLLHVTLVLVLTIFAINVFFARPVLESLLFAVALAVGLTPQLLPAVISVNLAHGARALAARKVIVKRLSAIESLGTLRALCVDKTGTLTTGEVELAAALGPDGRPSGSVWLHGHLNALHESGYLNPLDEALRRATLRRAPRLAKLDEVPFDFTRKRLSVLLAHRGQNRLITKGAVLPVLGCCDDVRTPAGREPMARWRGRLEAQLSALGDQGRRAVAVAERSLGGRTEARVEDEQGMTFLGLLVFEDPPKPGAREALAGLAGLGVRVKLVTGDHRAVAARVASQVGLSFERVVTGAELAGRTELELSHLAAAVHVFAEVEPAQKERLVRALKRREAVGFLGDGINDAGALHAADVGVSVDTAVDVAKDAAQIVLLEKDLGVLLEGVRGGRHTFANTLKYVFMATSANFGNMFSMAVASLFLPFLPLLPKQVLLGNLLTDLPEMTIATDRVDPEWVARPQHWDLRFIRRFMVVFGWISSLFDFGTFAVLLLLLGAKTAEFRTGWLVESVVSAALIVLVIRTRRPIWRSLPGRRLALTTLGTVAVALVLPLLPIARALSLVPLPGRFYAALLGVVALYVAAAELAKRRFYGPASRERSA